MAATEMQLEDWLDDLCVRFIINLPQEDLSSVARICFQVEEAQWFYEDFIRPLDPTLPSMSLRTFCLRIFQHCPLLASFSVENHTKAFEEFLQYKTRVPVRGAIMLNHAMDSVVLVKGWKKGANWSFPRGKINKDEDDLDCAVREVYEETGLDLRAAGLVPTEKKPKYIEISMREQQLRLYVFRDIPTDTKFQPRTRKEISKIQWYKLSELPAFRKKGAQIQNDTGNGPAVNKFYMVAPFLVPLKKWIYSQKKLNDKRATSGAYGHLPHHPAVDEVAITEDDTWAPGNPEKQSYVPAIETLDGATQELQRLLKMQPPTQGLQPPPQEDKGTALLSILQSNASRPAPPTQRSVPLPHTPLDATISEPPQPRNPHHHANFNPIHVQSRQPPPSFPYAPDHGIVSWNSNQPPHSQQHHIDTTRHQQPGQYQLSSTHSQAPPRQAQESMPQNGSFQSKAAPQLVGTSQNVPTGSATGLGSLTSQQNSQTSASPGSAKLSGASLALLNAFKRDTGTTQDNQVAMNPTGTGRAAPPGAQSSPYFDYSTPIASLNLLGGHSSRSAQQTNVSELVGSSVQTKGDSHRSALLDMFKKSPPNTTANQSQVGATQENRQETTKRQLEQGENMFLRQFQADRGPSSEHLSLEQLTVQSKSSQSAVPSPHVGESPSAHRHHQYQYSQPPQPEQQQPARSPLVSGHGQLPQPPRILQRGQRLDDISSPTVRQSDLSPKTSPLAAQNGAHRFPAAAPESSLIANTGHHTRRPDVTREQKQQLLSLFGKQPIPEDTAPASGTDPRQGADPPSSRVSSMVSRGGETPISPAEQTFLLDYLQSVTNNAGRR
ncbi:decapping enzyme Dcp2, putative [Metarhizium acridum CQMa 102]|uniref:Decapping enzyme Dcp2, putative n=1 Tax=Metarhizium acridum (strain CQMa 102) TaxID=655827 RepID=E9EEM2_METAQ|nr:decapping enzyme Dcp2, putative [Metarhizium acridum CQMa 102]EFY85604.1 decapping enzyme Dcp2, putative [Metarhizium acridum CQMa 102]